MEDALNNALQKYSILYYQKNGMISNIAKALLEKELGSVIIVSSLQSIDALKADWTFQGVDLIITDVREETDNGVQQIKETFKAAEGKPVIALCRHNNMRQYTEILRNYMEIIDDQLDPKTIIRRCKRAISQGTQPVYR